MTQSLNGSQSPSASPEPTVNIPTNKTTRRPRPRQVKKALASPSEHASASGGSSLLPTTTEVESLTDVASLKVKGRKRKTPDDGPSQIMRKRTKNTEQPGIKIHLKVFVVLF